MSIQATVCRLLLMSLCACAGCTLPADGTRSADALLTDQPSVAASGAAASDLSGPAASSSPPPPSPTPVGATAAPATAKSGSSAAPDPRVLDDVLAELATLGPIQPEAQQRLIDDLRKTDPAYWPMLVQTFRASLAYRRRSAERRADTRTLTSPAADDARARDEILQVAATEPAGDAVATTSATASAVEPTSQALPAAAPPKAADKGPTTDAPPNPNGQAPTNAAVNPVASQSPWQQHLATAIGELERQTHERPNDPNAVANQVHLRLLDLAAGRRDDALRPIPGIPPAQQDYWSKQLFALSTYLDSRQISDPTRRAAEAGMHLSQAVASLREQAPLVVRNLTLCSEVHSYGVLKRFEPAEFTPAKQVIVYAEVENFKSDETAQGFHTSLEASYQILDSQGRRVIRDDLSHIEDQCQNRRRDLFVNYVVTLPKTIYEGSYTLELTVEDKLAHKIGQSTMTFTIKPK